MTTKEIEEMAEDKNWDIGAVRAYLELGIEDNLDNFEEAYMGKWIDDEDFVRNLLEDMETIPDDLPGYVHIDWESTARDIMMDYSEENGYYFRNL